MIAILVPVMRGRQPDTLNAPPVAPVGSQVPALVVACSLTGGQHATSIIGLIPLFR